MQVYFYDADNALNYRERRNPNLRRDLLDIIQCALCECNPFSHVFVHARDVLCQIVTGNLAIRIVADPNADSHRYNTPSVDEVAVVVVGNDQQPNDGRDILLQPHNGGLQ